MTDIEGAVPVIPTFGQSASDSPKEGLDMRPDGSIHVWLDGQQIRLRRPRGREYRQLREALEEGLDAVNAAIDELLTADEERLRVADSRVAAGEPATTAEERAAERAANRGLRNLTEAAMLDWWAETFTVLGVGSPALDKAEAPAWLGETDTTQRVVLHWRSVPSLSGGR